MHVQILGIEDAFPEFLEIRCQDAAGRRLPLALTRCRVGARDRLERIGVASGSRQRCSCEAIPTRQGSTSPAGADKLLECPPVRFPAPGRSPSDRIPTCTQSSKTVVVSIRSQEGQEIQVDYRDVPQGQTIQFDKVLAISDENGLRTGSPQVAGATRLGRGPGRGTRSEDLRAETAATEELPPTHRPSPDAHQSPHRQDRLLTARGVAEHAGHRKRPRRWPRATARSTPRLPKGSGRGSTPGQSAPHPPGRPPRQRRLSWAVSTAILSRQFACSKPPLQLALRTKKKSLLDGLSEASKIEPFTATCCGCRVGTYNILCLGDELRQRRPAAQMPRR